MSQPPSGARTSTAYRKTYNSFSGVDIIATFGGKVVGELQGISYTVQREKAPIYNMGSADPRSFSRGKRGIAGSLVFSVFDRSALLETMRDRPYIANKDEVTNKFFVAELDVPTIEVGSGLTGSLSGSGNISQSRISIDKVLARPNYLDQVLPFDIVITAASEYGAYSKMIIHGVEILNIGSGLSIDDITVDEACTFIATRITPWHDQGFIHRSNDGKSVSFDNS
jgi:hypothetical protein